MLHCVVQPPGHDVPIHAICVHLGLRESHRQRQLHRLASLINSFPAHEPVVLAGDFNDWRGRAHSILHREAGLNEIFLQAGGRAIRTFPAAMPMLTLDRIYVRNTRFHAPVPLPRHPWHKLSDHAPLAAEISV
jgi:endonuclease/exonuclease/phosphatase family metal-dependent hydrolase